MDMGFFNCAAVESGFTHFKCIFAEFCIELMLDEMDIWWCNPV